MLAAETLAVQGPYDMDHIRPRITLQDPDE